MLRACISSTVFQFQDNFYHQIQGLAMGGSVSAVLANIVMEDLEINVHNTIPYFIYLYKRYHDDIFACVHHSDIDYVHTFFNDQCPAIQFTLEVENDGCLNFLDMSLLRSAHFIHCKWYQKPVASGRYLNFTSVQPFNFKKNVVSNLARRVIGLTDKNFRSETIQKGKLLLLQNCYPSHFIDKVFDEVIKTFNMSDASKNIQNKPAIDTSKVISLPYVPLLSENVSSMLRKFNFIVVNTNYNNLSFLWSPLKSKRLAQQLSCVVYQINCLNCDAIYIGQTKQQLSKRLNGHKYDKKEVTALHQHENNNGHAFDFVNTKVLSSETNDHARTLLEMIYIIKNSDKTCNFRADVEKLAVAYHPFFQPHRPN